jgi:hypothetical protein
MSDHFRSIDLGGFVLPGEVESRFAFADLPLNPDIPFAIVHLKSKHGPDETLRMDLDKRVFLGPVPDELRVAAPKLAQHIRSVVFHQGTFDERGNKVR